MSQNSFSTSSSLSSFTREAEMAMMARQIRVGRGYRSPTTVSWDSEGATEVDHWPRRDDYSSNGHDSAMGMSAFTPSNPSSQPQHHQGSFQIPSQQSWGGISRPSSRATSSRASSVGPVRRRPGSIVPEEDLLDTYPPVNTEGRNFRFGGKTYLLTYSQIGDLPNSALEEKMTGFGNQLKSE